MKRSIAFIMAVLIFAGLFAACSSDSKEIDISTLSQELLDSAAYPNGLEPIDLESGCYLYGLEYRPRYCHALLGAEERHL